MKIYCPFCDNLSEVKIQSAEEVLTVKGEKINITSEIAVCNECANKVFSEELDTKNVDLAYSIYRKKRSLLSPAEITGIRGKYALSQRSLANLLEWGEITINRYENGAIQDSAHNEVLNFIVDPKNMKEIFERNSQFLSQDARNALKKRIDELIQENVRPQFNTYLEDYIAAEKKIDEYSGFVKFDLGKIVNMIVYIAKKMKGVFTTKLNKLLWYADFLNFKEYTVSISGSNYIHLPLGPVPDNYEWIIAAAIDKGLLCEEEVSYPDGKSGMQYTALENPDVSLFSQDELSIIDFVINYFSEHNCADIKDISHKEKAYIETTQGQSISYKYAANLSINLTSK